MDARDVHVIWTNDLEVSPAIDGVRLQDRPTDSSAF
jgi:hypothetical protein